MFQKFSKINVFLSDKSHGNMKLEGKGSRKNRRKFLSENNISEGKLISAGIVHGSLVEIAEKGGVIFPQADGLVTSQEGIYLSVTVADCFPIFFYEKEKQIIALVHAGWRGIIEGVIGNTINQIKKLGGNVENICVAIGPGIGKCHFEVQDDVVAQFESYDNFVKEKDGRKFVDLRGMILKQLEEEGIEKGNIENEEICTFCEKQYFSYRRDKPENPEAMIAVIGLV